MPQFEVTVHIFFMPKVLNPEEVIVLQKLRELEPTFGRASGIRMGRCHVVSLEASDADDARDGVTRMCKRILINPVTDEFEIVAVRAIQNSK